jgi:uncharacterized integral membrane protein
MDDPRNGEAGQRRDTEPELEPHAETEPAPERDRRFGTTWQPALWFRLGLLVAIVGYAIAFIVQNTDEANVSYVFGDARTSLIWVILLSLVAGVIGGLLLSQLYRRSHRD